MLMVLVALVATLAVASTASAAGSTINYTGQGMDANGPITNRCNAPDNGGTGATLNPGDQYLLFVLNGRNVVGPVVLHVGSTTYNMVNVGGTWKVVTPFYSRADLLAAPTYATFTSGTANNLVVSHGCPGKIDGKIATTILDKDGNAITSASLGSKVHDSVTFTGTTGISMTDGATVTYHFYSGECGDNSSEVGTGETVAAGTNSSSTAALAAGSYHYVVSYSGNERYNPITASDCEPLTINKAQLAISTTIHNANHTAVTSVFSGSVVHDTATVTGQVAGFGIGDVSFTLNSNPVSTSATADPDSSVTARSVDSDPLAVGTYHYAASVAGNSNYLGANSDDEPLEVKAGAWCSPGFWKNTSDANWALTGYNRTDLFNSTAVPNWYDTPLPVATTLQDVLNNPSIAGPSGPLGLTAFNAVGAMLSDAIPGFDWNQQTVVDNCPLSNGR
jgi:hypothetical protein